MPWAGNIAKTMTSNGKQATVTREMFMLHVIRACTSEGDLMLSLELRRIF